MPEPTTAHAATYRDGHADGRLVSPSFERNAAPLIEALTALLAGRQGTALEIGAGTGLHACAFASAFPALNWTPSDPDDLHRKSCNAWRRHLGAATADALALDAASDWAQMPEVRAITPLALVISLNVIHIAPFKVARGILHGAGRALEPGGLLAFYGPFQESGAHIGEGNRIFDARLRADNPDWGVRDTAQITALGEADGLELAALIGMPSNNRLLVLRRT